MTDADDSGQIRIWQARTDDLPPAAVLAIRELLWAAFADDEEPFTEDDWQHGLGGMHFVLELDGTIVAHASVVERELRVGGRPLRSGYVEAVAVAPGLQGRRLGSRLMEAVNEHIRGQFEIGALGTGRHAFYERLGWLTWQGPLSVRTETGERRTPDDEGYMLVLPTAATPRALGAALDPTLRLSCDPRPGDVW